MRRRRRTCRLVVLLLLCGGADAGADPFARIDGLGPSPLRRLSREEYRRTVIDLLGIDADPFLDLIPPDPASPFDNDARSQVASSAWTEGAKAVAERIAAALVARPGAVAALAPCAALRTPGVDCLQKFIQTVGSRALRRPLAGEEVARYLAAAQRLHARDGFLVRVDLLVRAWLQNIEFLYRIEIGTPVPGRPDVRQLTPYETACRLSYLLWGTMPDDGLRARAATGRLLAGADLRQTAWDMMSSGRARAQVQRLHAMWLGYTKPPGNEAFAARLRSESDALVGKVIFDDKASWFDLFTATSTFVDDTLAKHYGMAISGEEGARWITYSGPGDRRGLLSHGSVLSNGMRFGDTSPTQRGLWIRRRLMCEEIPPPPVRLGVATDKPPAGDPKSCKKERYEDHTDVGCSGCHRNVDPIGFGLESFDAMGRFRTTEPGRPDCPVTGDGEMRLGGVVHAFKGPRELAETLIASGRLEACFVENLMRFVRGRSAVAAESVADEAMRQTFVRTEHRLVPLLVGLASSDAFHYRLQTPDVTP